MNNSEIRQTAKAKKVLLWEIAEAMGITDATLSRRLRKELPAEERDRLLGIIEDIAKRKRGE